VKPFLTFLFGCALPLAAISQTVSPHEPCGSGVLHAQRIAEEPGFDRSFARLEATLRVSGSAARVWEGVLRLPVVVHVLHTGEPEGTGANVSLAQIESAISAANADLRGLSGGIDTEIELVLARRTPDGQPTDGVVRVDASSVPAFNEEGIAASGPVGASEWSVKALSVWPAADYLNVWVVHAINGTAAGGGTLGFAYLPPAPNEVDGIVVRADAFGTVGDLSPFSVLNRTLTHELGHYLGLHHTFHATAACGVEADCALDGDRVCDTPPTLMNPACSGAVTCPEALTNNYMDYVVESCMEAFTEGQKARMRGVLEAARPALLVSLGAEPVHPYDGAVTGAVFASGTCVSGDAPGHAVVRNMGTAPLVTTGLEVAVNGSTPWFIELGDTLAPDALLEVPLPLLAWTAGVNQLALTLVSEEDAYAGNNVVLVSREVVPGADATMTVVPDVFGYETSWEIVDGAGEVWMSGGPYPNGTTAAPVATAGCLPAGCHTLVVEDSYGDGMSMGDGTFTLEAATGTVWASGGGNFGAVWEADFCVPLPTGFPCVDANVNGVCDSSEVPGCTDATACDFVAEATLSAPCTYPDPGFDCAGNAVVNISEMRAEMPRTLQIHPNPASSPVWHLSGLLARQTYGVRLRSLDGALAAPQVQYTSDSQGRASIAFADPVAAGVYLVELTGPARHVLRVVLQ
jgi:hypothetical protein